MKHPQSCKDCKKRVFELLESIYGKGNVFQNYNLGFPSKVEEFPNNELNSHLKEIYSDLQDYRGYRTFVKSKKLPNVDFYVRNKFILEFDESQHFTQPRLLTLKKYPGKLLVGFDKDKWIDQCVHLNKKDNDPPFRDEQRAWYDTIRDFVPAYLNMEPTVRLFASDNIWCSLNINSEKDIEVFLTAIKQKDDKIQY